MRSASIATRTTWPGPPSVTTSRVPGMRFSSISTARATCCISKPDLSGVVAPEGQRDDRHVVDALRLDDWRADAEVGRNPVAVGVDGVVEAHQRLDRVFADHVLHGDHRHARTRYRVDVLDAGDARQHLLGRSRHQVFDILDGRAREGDEDVGHRHVDLRLFLARRDQRGEDAQQQRDQRNQRRQRVAQEIRRNAARDAHFI